MGLLERAKAEAQETVSAGRGQQVTSNSILEYTRNLKDVLDAGSIGERRAFLRSFISTIGKQDSQATINYALLIPAEKVPIDPVRILDIDLSGGPAWIRTRDLSLIRTAL